jgi:hypothetical protein
MTVLEAIDSWAALLSSSSSLLVVKAGTLACQLASTSVNIINEVVAAANSPENPNRDRRGSECSGVNCISMRHTSKVIGLWKELRYHLPTAWEGWMPMYALTPLVTDTTLYQSIPLVIFISATDGHRKGLIMPGSHWEAIPISGQCRWNI